MRRTVAIDSRPVGEGQPTFVIAEIGINHNGDLDIAKKGCDTEIDRYCREKGILWFASCWDDLIQSQLRTNHHA